MGECSDCERPAMYIGHTEDCKFYDEELEKKYPVLDDDDPMGV